MQLGARMHYAVPRILADAELLENFYTDICATKSWPRLLRYLPRKYLPAAVRRLVGRIPNGVPNERIYAFTQFGLEIAYRRSRAKSPAEFTAVDLWSGKKLCELVCKHGFDKAGGIYTFNNAGLEIMHAARKEGLRCVMEQTIAPKRIELELLREEREYFPEWEPALRNALCDEYISREEDEWSAADLILCGSDFVRDGIIKVGGRPELCRVVPYGVDLPSTPRKTIAHSGPLRVLTVGQVGLRKGSPYVLGAAKSLKGRATFRMVGSIDVSHKIEVELRKSVELTGIVPRSEIDLHYNWADVFLLPSICEGSATATYEALAAGLPVICTTNTGSVIVDGKDGFIVPIRSPTDIVRILNNLIENPELVNVLSSNSAKRIFEISRNGYGKRLLSALEVVGA